MTTITAGVSLSVSVSGTANLQKALAAAKPGAPITLTGAQAPASSDGSPPSAAKELASASDAARNAILEAMQLYDPNASLTNYKDGDKFSSANGSSIDLIA